MLPEFTSQILDAERFDSEADAEEAAQVLRIRLSGLDPKAQAFILDDREIYVVYAGGGKNLIGPMYLKSFR